ncbi:MAG: hypothetical protein M3O33_04515 [Cyanobacteriota bacterium]|nr:hypothetical protein [Cyanobacteriota bacterium]
MKQNIFIPCDNRIKYQPVFRTNPNHLACASCGSTERKLGTGKEPHTASLRCGQCESVALRRRADSFITWLSKGELARIEAAQEVQQ